VLEEEAIFPGTPRSTLDGEVASDTVDNMLTSCVHDVLGRIDEVKSGRASSSGTGNFFPRMKVFEKPVMSSLCGHGLA